MRETKKYRMVFREKGGRGRRRVIRCTCTAEEVQGNKESWAMIVEEELGSPVECVEISEDTRRTPQ